MTTSSIGVKLGHYLVDVNGETLKGILYADSNEEVADYWMSPLVPNLTSHDQVPQYRQIVDLPELIADYRTASCIRCLKSAKKIPLFVVHTRYFNEMLVTFRKGQTNIYRISSCYRDGLNDLQTVDPDDFPFSHCFSTIERQKYKNDDQNRRLGTPNWIKKIIPAKPFELFLNEQFRNYSLKASLANHFYGCLASGKGLKPLCFRIENVCPTQFFAFVQCAHNAKQKCKITSSSGHSTNILLNGTFRTDIFRTGSSISIEFNDLGVLKPMLGSCFYYFPLGTSQNEHSTTHFRYATIPISGGNLSFEFNVANSDLRVRAKVDNVSYAELCSNENALSDQAEQYSSFLLNKSVHDILTGKQMTIITVEVNHDQFFELELKNNTRKVKNKCSIVVAWGIDETNALFNDDDSDYIIPSLQKCSDKRKAHCIPYDPSKIIKEDNEFSVNGNISDRFLNTKQEFKNSMARQYSGKGDKTMKKKGMRRKRETWEDSDDEITCCILKKDRTLKDEFTEAHRRAILHYFQNLNSEINCNTNLEAMQAFECPTLFDDAVANYISHVFWKAALESTTVTEFSDWVRYAITNWANYTNAEIFFAVESILKIPLFTNSRVGDGKKLRREALADFIIPQIMDHLFKVVSK